MWFSQVFPQITVPIEYMYWMYVCICVGLSMWVYRLWECVSEVYVFQYAFPSGKTYLCIYSNYIVSVSLLITCKQPLGDLTAHKYTWRTGQGEGDVCMGRIEPDSSTYTPLLWLEIQWFKKRNTEVRFHDAFHHVDADPTSTAFTILSLPCQIWAS